MVSLQNEFTFYDNKGVELGTIRKKIIKLIGEEYWVEKNGVEFLRIYGDFTEHDYRMTGETDHRVVIGAVIIIEHIEVVERQSRH
jgi:hypothetical protein